ncbi:hypothetical protein [Spirosoma flavum]|uniref:Uracil-DNA glycosylase n=1 Tax=Spirosoma flavum TaxID=2048557 RepID=A0ABW6ATW5_9BACT
MDIEAPFDQFKTLYKDKKLSDYDKPFIKDGVNNPDLFAKQKTKVLFIAKEHNYIGDHDDQTYAADYRVWSKQGIYLQFAHRLSEWAYGLMNNFPPYEQLTNKNKHEALQSIAFINVKKASGNASANPEHICQYIIASQSLLHQQITTISPTLIVCCFRYDYYVEILFDIKMKRANSNAYSLGKWDNMDIINFYHPSARKNKKVLYQQLAEAYQHII